MRLELLAWGIGVLAMLCQTGAAAPAAPAAPIVTHQALFAIPFRVEPTADAARRPVEVHLYVSTDRGAHWQLYFKTPPTKQQFQFRATKDGEYWFAIRTVDRSGQIRPPTITEPGLRVIVDTKSSGGPVLAQPPTKTQKAGSLSADDKTASMSESKGAVAIAINPPIGKKYAPKEKESSSSENVPGLPSGERPRMVNSRSFELEYEVDSVGPSGIGRVELWGTRDNGQTWHSFAVDNDTRSPMLVQVPEEGMYGFRVVVSNGVGFGGKPPKAGDQPDLWICIDLTKPTANIVSAQQGVDDETGRLIITWQADDNMLAARPVSLSFSQSRTGPWLPIASGLENTGRYAWTIDNRTPSQFYLRLEVRDEAGNVGICDATEEVSIDQSQPTVRVRDVHPVGQTDARSVR